MHVNFWESDSSENLIFFLILFFLPKRLLAIKWNASKYYSKSNARINTRFLKIHRLKFSEKSEFPNV